MDEAKKRWFTTREIAAHLQIAYGTLRNWTAAGLIPHHHIRGVVRFDLDEVEAWARENPQATSTTKE